MSTILLCAGGTGGHLFPAEALAHELIARGHDVQLVTDERAGRFASGFPASAVHSVPSATFGSRNPVALVRSLWRIWRGFRTSSALIRRVKPAVVVGFGGYPTVPPLMAAVQAGKPTLVHEQNAVMGRANRMLGGRVQRIAFGIAPERLDPLLEAKASVTGNPVRPPVLEAAAVPYLASEAGAPFELVVFGGSQGAQFFSTAVPAAIALLPAELRDRLRVTQQARAEDQGEVRTFYERNAIPADVAPFFGDMPARIGRAHLVVSRSGASTVSEIAVIGRPSLLVPYPYALDHDQAANAARLEAGGATTVVRQADLTPERLAEHIRHIAQTPAEASSIAQAARQAGIPDAARLLADLIESMPAPVS